jgi:hypothetical protein
MMLNQDSEITWLKELGEQCVGFTKTHSRVYGDAMVADYNDNIKINTETINRIDKIIKNSNDIVMYPINTCMGFSIGFRVARIKHEAPGAPIEQEILLQIKIGQIEGCKMGRDSKNQSRVQVWNSIKYVFLTSENMRRIEYYGLEKIKDDPYHYDY